MSIMRKDEVLAALDRIKGQTTLTQTRTKAVEKLVDLLGADGKTTVDAVHASLYENIEPSSANRELNRLVTDFNKAAEDSDAHMRLIATLNKKAGAKGRHVYFETDRELSPNILTEDLNAVGDKYIDPKAIVANAKPIVAVMTFNPIEFEQVRAVFDKEYSPIRNSSPQGFYLGTYGKANVYLFRPGGQGVVAAQSQAQAICDILHPYAIFVVGIGWGANGEKQKIGDVLVPWAIYNCNALYSDKRGNIRKNRSSEYPTSSSFKTIVEDLPYTQGAKTVGYKIHTGKSLSYSEYLDDVTKKEQLIYAIDELAIGGEMEMAGVAEVAYQQNFHWLLFKGISDFSGNYAEMSRRTAVKKASKNAAHAARAFIEEYMPHLLKVVPPAQPVAPLQLALPVISLTNALDMIAEKYVPIKGTMTDVGKRPAYKTAANIGGLSVDIADALQEWANDDGAPPIFAILAEYGMGKTVTSQRFYKTWREQQSSNPALRPAMYFDLRDVSVNEESGDTPSLDDVLWSCVQTGWLTNGAPKEMVVGDIYSHLQKGSVVIFDGLDEVLVKLNQGNGALFAKRLLGVIKRYPKTKLLITTRTQYFRTLREQNNLLTLEERGDTKKEAFRAMELLPFNEHQVREYLRKALKLSDSEIQKIVEMVSSVHDLSDLTKRPYTLSFVAEMIPDIEELRNEGKPIYGVTLYREMVNRWLERDASKTYIVLDDKFTLAEDLAAHFWRNGLPGMKAKDLNEWLYEWLDTSRYLTSKYATLNHDRLEEDLRNSTFLARSNDDVFRFSHTSMQEYFVAKYLYEAVKHDNAAAWNMPKPSDETLDFFGQMMMEDDVRELLATMQGWAQRSDNEANQNLLFYAMRAEAKGYPQPSLRKLNLNGADLNGLTISIDLPEANLSHAKLRDARFEHINLRCADFTAADLTRARVLGCNLNSARLDETSLIGTIFRKCNLDGMYAETPNCYRTQLTYCQHVPLSLDAARCLISPEKGVQTEGTSARAALRSVIGHSVSINSAAWSPDGTRIVSGGDDSTVRIWDAQTGESVGKYDGHIGYINSAAWSPDGTRIVSGGSDSTVRIWDAQTGESVGKYEGHSGTIRSVAWSPDGKRIVSGGYDSTVRIWDAQTGESVGKYEWHSGTIWSVAWSPDGTRIVSGGNDCTVRIWDAQTGESVGKYEMLPNGNHAVWNGDGSLRFATEGAWEYLGWQTTLNGKLDILPAERFGYLPLPPSRDMA